MRGRERTKKPQTDAETRARLVSADARTPRTFLRRHPPCVVALWAFALLAYSNSFQSGLIFDNATVIGQDTRIREATASNLRLILIQSYWYGRSEACGNLLEGKRHRAAGGHGDLRFHFHVGPAWRARIAGYIAAALPIAVFLAMRAYFFAGVVSDPVAFTENPLVAAGFWTARLTAIQVLVRYLWLLFWPLRLSYDYSYNQFPLGGWSDWKTLASLAVCLSAAAAAVVCWRRAKPVCFFIEFFFAALAPTSNLLFLFGTIMAERFLYLPAIAMAGCAVLAWRAAGRRWTRVLPLGRAVLVLVCAALAVRTWARNSDWNDNVTLLVQRGGGRSQQLPGPQ